MDALKNFMSTMTNTMMQQVSKQVKKAVEAASSARPLPRFKYVPATGSAPSHRYAPIVSHHHRDGMREALHPPPEPGTVDKVNHGLNTVRNALATNRLVRVWGAHPMLKRPPSMTSAPKPHNARKYHEFFEQNRHTTAECQELRKALHELADKGQIDRFLKRGPRFLREEREPARPEPRDRDSGHYHRWIRRGHHSVHLEGSALRVPASSHG
ncbi:hypothetical protein Cgig2_023007 [Carnegiea gigantea]|uniref:Uncharacterized protein n=1 Tax=Carnegiea gigantea TaxID=171969 RepID=A0A9Q1JGE7_9CARY|nr:hypothetical protein Cgig2_023007 [Carnegiea gigantea]